MSTSLWNGSTEDFFSPDDEALELLVEATERHRRVREREAEERRAAVARASAYFDAGEWDESEWWQKQLGRSA